MAFVIKKETLFTRTITVYIPDGDEVTSGEITVTFELLSREEMKTTEDALIDRVVKKISGIGDPKTGKEMPAKKQLDEALNCVPIRNQLVKFYLSEVSGLGAKN